jgi:hypothetical protein
MTNGIFHISYDNHYFSIIRLEIYIWKIHTWLDLRGKEKNMQDFLIMI